MKAFGGDEPSGAANGEREPASGSFFFAFGRKYPLFRKEKVKNNTVLNGLMKDNTINRQISEKFHKVYISERKFSKNEKM